MFALYFINDFCIYIIIKMYKYQKLYHAHASRRMSLQAAERREEWGAQEWGTPMVGEEL